MTVNPSSPIAPTIPQINYAFTPPDVDEVRYEGFNIQMFRTDVYSILSGNIEAVDRLFENLQRARDARDIPEPFRDYFARYLNAPKAVEIDLVLIHKCYINSTEIKKEFPPVARRLFVD